MKKFFLVFFIVIGISLLYSEDVRYKPYVLAGIEKGEMNDAVTKVENLLTENGFEILGKYSPLQDKNRVVICITNEVLKKTAGKFLNKYGGLLAYAAVTRFALYKENDNIEVSYRNPIYWGNAYFQKDFPAVEKDYITLNFKMVEMCKGLSEVKNAPYGSKKGLTAKKLWKYRFGIFMPYFDDVVTYAKKTNYDEILKKIDENFPKSSRADKVFSLSFPDKKLTLIGVGEPDEKGEPYFLPKLDKKYPKQDAFLPWEILVMKDKVVAFNGKYFMALAYPDAGMGTFMKIRKGGAYNKTIFNSLIVGEKK
ncbi:MAG: hypothetical protein KAW12_14880 [Candidatus Aminicenantes bacterium]|nr:hypothetical protein [Candidatus Aminicenantes bacterium]